MVDPERLRRTGQAPGAMHREHQAKFVPVLHARL